MSVLALRGPGIERSPRRLLRYRPPGRTHQAVAPKFPRPAADPARFGRQHGIGKMIGTEFTLEAEDCFKRRQVHRLSKDPCVRTRPQSDRLPPEKSLFQLGRQLSREAVPEGMRHIGKIARKPHHPPVMRLVRNGKLSEYINALFVMNQVA